MKGLGKSYRKGITLLEVTERFSTVEKAKAWFIEQCSSNGIACPKCGDMNIAITTSRKAHAVPVSWLPQALLGQDWHSPSIVQHSSEQVGYRVLSLYDEPQRRIVDEATPRPRYHSEVGMAHRIRETLAATGSKFAGPVEVDETYIRGQGMERTWQATPIC